MVLTNLMRNLRPPFASAHETPIGLQSRIRVFLLWPKWHLAAGSLTFLCGKSAGPLEPKRANSTCRFVPNDSLAFQPLAHSSRDLPPSNNNSSSSRCLLAAAPKPYDIISELRAGRAALADSRPTYTTSCFTARDCEGGRLRLYSCSWLFAETSLGAKEGQMRCRQQQWIHSRRVWASESESRAHLLHTTMAATVANTGGHMIRVDTPEGAQQVVRNFPIWSGRRFSNASSGRLMGTRCHGRLISVEILQRSQGPNLCSSTQVRCSRQLSMSAPHAAPNKLREPIDRNFNECRAPAAN